MTEEQYNQVAVDTLNDFKTVLEQVARLSKNPEYGLDTFTLLKTIESLSAMIDVYNRP